jgi:hypothetical protein
MGNALSRDRDKGVTGFLPILIPCAGAPPSSKNLPLPGSLTRLRGPAGHVVFQEGASTRIQPVERFSHSSVKTSARFAAVAKLFSLASGKAIDRSMIRKLGLCGGSLRFSTGRLNRHGL